MARRRGRAECPACGEAFDTAASAEEHFRSTHALHVLRPAEQKGAAVVWRNESGAVVERLSFATAEEAAEYIAKQHYAEELSRMVADGRLHEMAAAAAGHAIGQEKGRKTRAADRAAEDAHFAARARAMKRLGGPESSDRKIAERLGIGRGRLRRLLELPEP
jgi:hypothetical protein